MSSNDMKMLVAIVRDSDLDEILGALLEENFRVTRIASSGGFFRRGNATLMIGVSEKRVDQALQIIRERCALTNKNVIGNGHSIPDIDTALHCDPIA